MSRDIDIAWAAGLLEGEGTFLLKTSTTYPTVQVHLTDLDVLEKLQRVFGGQINPITKRKEHWKDAWIWSLYGEVAIACMEDILPHMGERRFSKIDYVLTQRSEFVQEQDRRSKYLEDIQNQIIADYGAGLGSIRDLAKQYGIGRTTVWRWINLAL